MVPWSPYPESGNWKCWFMSVEIEIGYCVISHELLLIIVVFYRRASANTPQSRKRGTFLSHFGSSSSRAAPDSMVPGVQMALRCLPEAPGLPPLADYGAGRPEALAARREKGKFKTRAAENVSPLWKTRMCEFWQLGKCRKGIKCSFAHGEDDLRPSPDFAKTSVCPVFLHTGKCDAKNCRYAHSVDELKVQPHLLKSKMCSFFLMGRCVVGPACRFAHSDEELEQAQAVVNKMRTQLPLEEDELEPLTRRHFSLRPPQAGLHKFLKPTALEEPEVETSEEVETTVDLPDMLTMPQSAISEDVVNLATIRTIPDVPQVDEPPKVVIAASWEDDLLEPTEPISSLKNRTSPGNQSRPQGKVKLSRARRVLVDTFADVEEFPAEIISALAATRETADGLVQLGGSPGLLDLSSRQRQPVIVIDIEDAQHVCQGKRHFKTDGQQSVQIRRRHHGHSRGKAEHRSKSEHRSGRGDRAESRSSPVRPATATKKDSERSEKDRRKVDTPEEGDVSCRATDKSLRRPVLRVMNTFLTVEEEEDDEEFPGFPLRRTQSM